MARAFAFTPRLEKVCFIVDDGKGFYHCFATNAHGDAIDLVMRMEGLDFCSAVALACDLADLPPPGVTRH